MEILAIFDPLVDLIVNRISESSSTLRDIIVGIILISIITTIKSLLDYFYNNLNDIIYKVRGKHRIDTLKEKAQEIRRKTIEAQSKLKHSDKVFDLKVNEAIGKVTDLSNSPKQSFKENHREAISKVATLKKIHDKQHLEIRDILSEMLANSSEAEKWFSTRNKRIAEQVKKHSPARNRRDSR